MKRAGLLMIMLIAVVLAVGLAAAQGGSTKPSLTVTPTSPTVGSNFTVTSCGWNTSGNVHVGLEAWHSGNGQSADFLTPDATGCVSTTFSAWDSGSWLAQAYKQNAQRYYANAPSAELNFTVN